MTPPAKWTVLLFQIMSLLLLPVLLLRICLLLCVVMTIIVIMIVVINYGCSYFLIIVLMIGVLILLLLLYGYCCYDYRYHVYHCCRLQTSKCWHVIESEPSKKYRKALFKTRQILWRIKSEVSWRANFKVLPFLTWQAYNVGPYQFNITPIM